MKRLSIILLLLSACTHMSDKPTTTEPEETEVATQAQEPGTLGTMAVISPKAEITFPKEKSMFAYAYPNNVDAFYVKGNCYPSGNSVQIYIYGGKSFYGTCGSNGQFNIPLKLSDRADGEFKVIAIVQNASGKAVSAPMIYNKNTSGRQIYVKYDGGSNSNPGTKAAPYKDFWKAIGVAQAGDVINVEPRPNGQWMPNMYISDRHGLPGKPITVQGADPLVKTRVTTSKGQTIHLNNSSYINIRNFEVTNNAGMNCIFANGKTSAAVSHHFEFTENKTYSCPAAGIATVFSDYVVMAYNDVTNTSWDTDHAWHSGLSMYANRYVDQFTGVKNIIRGNKISHAFNKPKTGCTWTACGNSDGNGIIIDDLRNTQHASGDGYIPPYNYGKTIVEDNIIFSNGGRGLNIYSSKNVLAQHNTLWQSNKDPFKAVWRPGEIHVNQSHDVEVLNNIAVSDGLTTYNEKYGLKSGQHVSIAVLESKNVLVKGNVSWNPQGNKANSYYERWNTGLTRDTASEVFVDPQFVNPTSQHSTANFSLKAGSPAAGKGARF